MGRCYTTAHCARQGWHVFTAHPRRHDPKGVPACPALEKKGTICLFYQPWVGGGRGGGHGVWRKARAREEVMAIEGKQVRLSGHSREWEGTDVSKAR